MTISNAPIQHPIPTDEKMLSFLSSRAWVQWFAEVQKSIRDLQTHTAGIYNVKHWGAIGDGVIDDTAAIQAAIAFCIAVKGALTFPEGIYKTTTNLAITGDDVRLLGSQRGASVISFAPASESACITISKSAAEVIYRVGIENLTLDGSATSVKKHAIRVIDGSDICLRNVHINGWLSTGNDSTGLQLRGRQIMDFDNITIDADIPVSMEDNPNSTNDADHYHFANMYLVANALQPCVKVASGINVSNITFDGYQSWVRGKYGLYWSDTATSTAAMNVVLKNIRHEQADDANGWIVYIAHNTQLYGLVLENVFGGLTTNGYYFRKVSNATLKEIVHLPASLVCIDCDSSCRHFTIINPWFDAGSTANVTGFNPVCLNFYRGTWNPAISLGSVAPTSPMQIVGLAEYADNAAAVAAGLTVGAFYRTGDALKVVN